MSRPFCFILAFTLTLPWFAGMPDPCAAYPAVLMACCVAPIEQAAARAGRWVYTACVIGGVIAVPLLADWMHNHVPMVGFGYGCTGAGRVEFAGVIAWLAACVLCTGSYPAAPHVANPENPACLRSAT